MKFGPGLAILILLLTCTTVTTYAQKSQHVWYFGTKVGLDFNTSPATVLRNGAQATPGGTASVADPMSGKLLFYTDGTTVWNAQHRSTPNGTGLLGIRYSEQPAIIVPDPKDNHRYYLFTAPGYQGPPAAIYYSIIDMRLDGGLGDVAEKNIFLMDSAAEGLGAVSMCSEEAHWIITHKLNSDEYVVWRLDANGLSKKPVTSKVGLRKVRGANSISYFAISPAGDRLAVANAVRDTQEIFDFDLKTGVISNPLLIRLVDTGLVHGANGVAFSPGGSKLYFTGWHFLHRFDLADPDPNTIRNSHQSFEIELYTKLTLAPDGNIYINLGPRIGRIVNADSINFELDRYWADISSLNSSSWSMPTFPVVVEVCPPPIADFGFDPDSICEKGCLTFSDSSKLWPTRWSWTFEGGVPSSFEGQSPGSVCYYLPGNYRVQLIAANNYGSDTLVRTVRIADCPLPEIFVPDTIICATECIVLSDTSRFSTAWKWQFTGGNPRFSSDRETVPICYREPGDYEVILIASNEYGSDTATSIVHVIDCGLPVAQMLHDTLICVTDSLVITNASKAASSWSWRFEAGAPSSYNFKDPPPIRFSAVGRHEIRLIVGHEGKFDTAYSFVTVWDCAPPLARLRDDAVCVGDSIFFSDESSNYPTGWEWRFEGGTPTSSASKEPGHVRFESPGVHIISLIASNEFGADTAYAKVTVLSATPTIRPASIDIAQSLSTCSTFDTAVWIYAGCKESSYQLNFSGSSSIDVAPQRSDIAANDSLRVGIFITPSQAGTFTSTIVLDLNGELHELPIHYSVSGIGGLEASLSSIDFGETSICEERDTTVRFTNTGCDTLTITDAEIDRNFIVGGDLPIRLAPGESIELPITTVLDTIGNPRTLTGLLTVTSNADNILAPITLSRRLFYPTKLRVEAVDEASGKAGDEAKFRIILDGNVPSRMTALHFDFLHNNDLLSFESLDGAGLSITQTQGESDQRQSFTLSPVHAGVLGELTFKAYLAEAEQTTLSFDNIRFDAEGVSFAPECIAVISDSGTRFNYVYECGDDMIRSALRGETLIKSLTPNPATNEIRLELAHGVGEAEVVIVDMLGKEVLRTVASDRIDVSGLISGTYYLRVSASGAVQTRRVIIER